MVSVKCLKWKNHVKIKQFTVLFFVWLPRHCAAFYYHVHLSLLETSTSWKHVAYNAHIDLCVVYRAQIGVHEVFGIIDWCTF